MKTIQAQNKNKDKDKELVLTIEKLFDDPIKRRALYFNLKYKETKADFEIVLKQRNEIRAEKIKLQLQLQKERRIRIIIVVGCTILGISAGIGFTVLGAKIGQLVSAWR
jgi:hypothetical protein